MSNPDQNNLIKSAFLSSLVSRSITYPLDTIKTRIQYKNNIKTNNLFRGVSYSLIISCPALGVYLATYELAKNKINKDHFTTHILSAFTAEIVSSVFWTPLDVIKSKVQTNSLNKTTKIINSLLKEKGISYNLISTNWMAPTAFMIKK